jgi:hypothetical protein
MSSGMHLFIKILLLSLLLSVLGLSLFRIAILRKNITTVSWEAVPQTVQGFNALYVNVLPVMGGD